MFCHVMQLHWKMYLCLKGEKHSKVQQIILHVISKTIKCKLISYI